MNFQVAKIPVALSAIISFASCNDKLADHPVIAVSIPPQATILKEVAGDSVEVVTLTDAATNPESFEVTVTDMKAVSSANAYIAMGNLSFEQALTQRLKERGDVKVYDCSTGIELIYGTHSHDNNDHDGIPDPHTWSSVSNIRTIAANMLKVIEETDPANAAYYQANFNRLKSRLDSIDQSINARLDSAGHPAFLIWHPSLSYLARDYNLQQIAVGSENKESSPATMRDNIETASNANISAFFIQSNFDSRQAENLSRELNVEPTQINPLDPDWEKQLNIIIDALTSDTH